jgi:hypothetical protein
VKLQNFQISSSIEFQSGGLFWDIHNFANFDGLELIPQENSAVMRSVGQYIAAVKMNLSRLERSLEKITKEILSDSQQLLDECLVETRTISHLLHPPLLIESGLRAAAEWYVDGFSQRVVLKLSCKSKT